MSKLKFSLETQHLLEFDSNHLWHPYTSMRNPLEVYPVKSANGCEITLDTESPKDYTLIEAMASWWCMIHGYNNPELNEALKQQVEKVSHVMFGGLTHRPAIELVQKILELVDHKELQCCFLSDSGSVAVEVAMKMALQYHFSLHGVSNKKKKFLTINHGYHGDTFGAMSVCDPVNSMHSMYNGYLAENIFAAAPSTIDTLPTSKIYENNQELFEQSTNMDEEDIADFRQKIESHHESICAVILEPILQGAGGMRLYHPQFLIEVRKLCNQYKVPLIMDEIATGFGRTGAMFAFHHCRRYQEMMKVPAKEKVDVYPDILCLGKALTGGYMTLSAVVTTKHIAAVISSPNSDTGGCFMHGPTFMGNPLACAVANKSLEILKRGTWATQVSSIEEQLFRELYLPLNANKELMESIIKSVRVVGAVGVVELKQSINSAWFQEKFIERGIYVRPFNKLCYIMPPYVITEDQLRKVTSGIKDILSEWKEYLFKQEKN